MKYIAITFVFGSLVMASTARALIPDPTANQLSASFAGDSCIKIISPTAPPFTTVVQACSVQVAQALTLLLNPEPNRSNVDVVDPNGKRVTPASVSSLSDLAQVADLALRGNRFYSKAYPYDPLGIHPTEVLIEFKSQVIKVFVDNISNPYGTDAYVAADLFQLLLNQQAGTQNFKLMTVTGP